jgi:4-hydroxybenzoyl-CoA reductase subunit beta
MLRLPPFSLREPNRLEEACRILAAEGPTARPVAGGTDLWPNMKRRHQRAETVVSLMKVPELKGVDVNGGARIGATTLLSDILESEDLVGRYPAFARAVGSISSPPLRNMGTLGGNLCLDTRCTYYNQTEEWRRAIDYCMKEEGTICWVAPSSPRCWAHSASDAAPILCALGAEVLLVRDGGERVSQLPELYRNDGIDYLNKDREEILVEVRLPDGAAAERCRSAFWKLRRRGSIDFAVASVGAAVWTDPGGVVERASIFLGAVGSYPIPARRAAERLAGRRLDEEAIAEAAALARKQATPLDNTDYQAQWRGLMVARYTEAALREIAGLEPGLRPPAHL